VIEIFGVTGRRVETLCGGAHAAGEYVATWPPGEAPSGIYFARLTAGGESLTAKFALIR
jgi:hypothetical protein